MQSVQLIFEARVIGGQSAHLTIHLPNLPLDGISFALQLAPVLVDFLPNIPEFLGLLIQPLNLFVPFPLELG